MFFTDSSLLSVACFNAQESVFMQPKELTIRTQRLTLSAIELGDPEGKPVLAVHGWLDNAASFIPLAEKLEGIRLVAIDLPGHGLSSHRPEGWSYDVWHYVEDLLDIVEVLKWSSFGLIGHSLGAVICTMAAATVFKKRVTGLVLIDGISPAPRLANKTPHALEDYILQRRTPIEELPTSRYRSFKQAVRARCLGLYKVSQSSATLLVERGLRPEGDEWVWRADRRLKLSSPARFTLEQSIAFVQAVSCRAELVFAKNGELSGFIARHQDVLTTLYCHELVGSHHLHMDEQVEAVALIVNAVLT